MGPQTLLSTWQFNFCTVCQSAPSFCGGISISRIWWSPVPTGSQGAWCGEVTAAFQRQGQDSLRKAWKRWNKEPTEPQGAACYYECTGGPCNASPRLWNSDIRCKTATANRPVWLSKCMSTWGTYYVSSLRSCPQNAMSRKWIVWKGLE